MMDKIINEKLNKKGLKLLFWEPVGCDEGMWVVSDLNNKTKSIHFELEDVIERWLKE